MSSQMPSDIGPRVTELISYITFIAKFLNYYYTVNLLIIHVYITYVHGAQLQ